MYIKNQEGRTSADYRFTVTDKKDPAVLALKKTAAKNNKSVREFHRKYNGGLTLNMFNSGQQLLRVAIKARGPRKAASLRDSGGRNSTMYQSHLPHADATHFDVYLSVDTHNQWMLKEELRTGLDKIQIRETFTVTTANICSDCGQTLPKCGSCGQTLPRGA